MSRVKLFSDVDGVLNISSDSDETIVTDSEAFVRIPHVNTDGKTRFIERELRWNASVISFLQNLPVDFFWVTGWMQKAPEILDPLWGINSKGSFSWERSFNDEAEHGKGKVIAEELIRNPSPFIWIDDIATKSELFFSHFNESQRAEVIANSLIIVTDPDVGLSEFDMSRIQAFLEEHNSI